MFIISLHQESMEKLKNMILRWITSLLVSRQKELRILCSTFGLTVGDLRYRQTTWPVSLRRALRTKYFLEENITHRSKMKYYLIRTLVIRFCSASSKQNLRTSVTNYPDEFTSLPVRVQPLRAN